MHLKAVSDVIFLLKEEKKKVGFWSLVVDVPLLIFSSFYFIFIKTTNRGRDISNFGPFFFFFCILLTVISNNGALSSATTVNSLHHVYVPAYHAFFPTVFCH